MAKFAARHYEAVAQVLQDTRPANDTARVTEARDQWNLMADKFATMFADDNDKFDRDRFDKAAGV